MHNLSTRTGAIRFGAPAAVIGALAAVLTAAPADAAEPVRSTPVPTGALPSFGPRPVTAAVHAAEAPLRHFMSSHTREEDIALMTRAAGRPNPDSAASVPMLTLIPAFMISELRAAFIIGFVIFVPFLVIDMVVSAALMSMGMMMLPPVMISLPFKILLFVLVDGWGLIIKSLIESYQVVH